MQSRFDGAAVSGTAKSPRGDRDALRWITAAYTLFVVYGSLVPLSFQPHPLAEAWARFRAIPTLKLGIASRADWVSNIILFVPLAFLWTEVAARRRSPILRGALSGLVVLGCLLLSGAIEFAQIFFPPRTVSMNDLIAEGIGAGIGVAGAWMFGARARRALSKLGAARGEAALAERALWIYLGLVLLYNVMPLDLTLSPVEIYHKWKEGRVVLNPFQSLPSDPVSWLYGAASDVLIWAPVSALWIVAGRGGFSGAAALTIGAAAAVEGAQLFIYTRVCDVGDILTAALGALLGAAIGSRLRGRVGVAAGPSSSRWAMAGGAAAGAWLFVLAALFWYPFNFRLERAFALERLAMLRQVPFLSYYMQSEYWALGGLLRKTLLFVPLGSALGIAAWPVSARSARRLAAVGAALVALLAAAAVELGQAFLPGKYPDSTDFLLEMIGAIAGYALVAAIRARVGAGRERTRP
jgi:VanZ family protein